MWQDLFVKFVKHVPYMCSKVVYLIVNCVSIVPWLTC